MRKITKTLGLFVLLFTLAFVLETVVAGRTQQASALEEAPAAAETSAELSQESGEENGGYSVFYYVADGVTAVSLVGVAEREGWELALWLTLIYWIMALTASILMVVFSNLFLGKDDGKPFNKIALLGFIWSLFMPLAGIILSVVGKRMEKTHEGGKVYYMSVLIIGGAFILLAIILAIVHACAPFLPF